MSAENINFVTNFGRTIIFCKCKSNSFEFIVNIESCTVESNKILNKIIPYKIPYEALLNNVLGKFNNPEWCAAVLWDEKSFNIPNFTREYSTTAFYYHHFSTLHQLAIRALQTVNILLQMFK